MDELYHHGIKGQRWGVRRFQNPDGTLTALGRARKGANTRKLTSSEVSGIANRISEEVAKYKNSGPAGNQNCQLCTWSMEMQFRGENVLPRPVYSPRDIEFTLNGYDIVKNPKKIGFKNKQDLMNTVAKAGDGSRFYTHVNWKGSSGGHEFIITNMDGKVTVVDAQNGTVAPLTSKKGSFYVTNIDFNNSFVVRMDDKEINRDTLKYNDKKYITKWDFEKDAQYMLENDMLSEEDKQYLEELKMQHAGDALGETLKHSMDTSYEVFVVLGKSYVERYMSRFGISV